MDLIRMFEYFKPRYWSTDICLGSNHNLGMIHERLLTCRHTKAPSTVSGDDTMTDWLYYDVSCVINGQHLMAIVLPRIRIVFQSSLVNESWVELEEAT